MSATPKTDTPQAAGRPATAPGSSPARITTALRHIPARIRFEVLGYFRSLDTVFFTFAFPVLMLLIFNAAFGSGEISPGWASGALEPGEVDPGPAVSIGAYYLPGLVAAGVLLSGVQNLAIDIAMEKGGGHLKQLGGTPMHVLTYLLGKLGQVVVTALLQLAMLLLVARYLLGIALPSSPASWLTFAWVFALGLAASATIGIALSALPRTSRSASAVVVPIVLVLQFISGVYLQFYLLPDWMTTIARLFPLAWMAQGMRAVFLPEEFAVLEIGETWALPQVALALGVWLVIGTVIARATFTWNRRDA